MKLSAVTLIKNANKFDYPIVESINSVICCVDEYIINVGQCDDGTKELIQKHFGQEDKVVIFESDWEDVSKGTAFFSNQTNLAISKATGDWILYLQADECLHEKDIYNLKKWIDRAEKENLHGLTFKYNHFALDPNHVKKTYSDGFDFYEREIRLFKNDGSLVSFGDGQSFCFVEDYLDPRGPQPAMHRAERFLDSPLEIYHYSYLRDRKKLLEKKKYLEQFYKVSEPDRKESIIEENGEYVVDNDSVKEFKGTHPAVMIKRIK